MDIPVHQLSLSDYKPVSLVISVEGYNITMEIDTGSALSCVNKETYDLNFSHLPIKQSQITLSFYDGSIIKPLGYIEVLVNFRNKSKLLDLYVISNGTTSLLGRQWLTELKIDIPKFNVCNINNRISDNSANDTFLEKLFNRYSEVWSGGLGRYSGGTARLVVREGATPVFCRARPLPYALRDRVDAELDRMLAAALVSSRPSIPPTGLPQSS